MRRTQGSPPQTVPKHEVLGMKCTSCMKKVSQMLATVSVLLLVATAIYQSNLESNAILVQRVKPHDQATADLLGEVGTPIGSPQRMIVSDQRAFLPGKGEQGERFVNDDYLKEHDVYPLQAKTVGYVGGLVKLGLAGIALVGFLAAWWFGRRERSCRIPFATSTTKTEGASR